MGGGFARDFRRHRRAAVVQLANGFEQAGGLGFFQQVPLTYRALGVL
jgi:hypothetical protein